MGFCGVKNMFEFFGVYSKQIILYTQLNNLDNIEKQTLDERLHTDYFCKSADGGGFLFYGTHFTTLPI